MTVVAAEELGPWDPLSLESVTATFERTPFRWWISGGLALELHLGRSWRRHDDIDVGVLRRDLPAVRDLLARWDIHVAAAGKLTLWQGEDLVADRHQNNLWCRLDPSGPWMLDLTIGEGTDKEWIYRRDPQIRRPWSQAVLHTADGIPYLAPDLQLLYKSKDLRPKDDLDAQEVIPALEPGQRAILLDRLEPAHPSRRLHR